MTRSQGIVDSNLTGKQIRIRRRHLWKGVFDMYLDAHAYKVITHRPVSVKLCETILIGSGNKENP